MARIFRAPGRIFEIIAETIESSIGRVFTIGLGLNNTALGTGQLRAVERSGPATAEKTNGKIRLEGNGQNKSQLTYGRTTNRSFWTFVNRTMGHDKTRISPSSQSWPMKGPSQRRASQYSPLVHNSCDKSYHTSLRHRYMNIRQRRRQHYGSRMNAARERYAKVLLCLNELPVPERILPTHRRLYGRRLLRDSLR